LRRQNHCALRGHRGFTGGELRLARACRSDDYGGAVRREEAAPPGNDVQSRLTLEAEPRLQPGLDYLMRCDRVDFPPGGLAWTHTHKGPGIRCLQSGRIRIETQGHDFWVEPGEAWFETGVDPVFAETRPDGPSHFLRVMILPRSIRGKSSITYVKPEDQDKPKTQSYQVFVDEPIELNQS
jgi:hypothetical protein